MILAHGFIYDTGKQDEILGRLIADTNDTLKNKSIDTYELILAIDRISKGVINGEFDDIISQIDIEGIEEYKLKAACMLSRENIELTLKTQLPRLPELPDIVSYYAPVGVLFHIAAGNVDVLPAYTVLEGLLCGNINILKLPSQDNGLTVGILKKVIDIMPSLADFIYVFDTPSSDVAAMIKMAEAADKIVVWGGDEAVKAVRAMAPPSVKLVEWGHKIGFAYVGSDYRDHAGELEGLALHMIRTSQLFCSSVQRIFVDSDDPSDADAFCRFFLPILQKQRDDHPAVDIGAAAELTLLRLAERTERAMRNIKDAPKRTYFGRGCSLTANDDAKLEVSGFFGNCDVSALSSDKLFDVLREKKGYLQTASFIGDVKDAERIATAAGIVRIMRPDEMSEAFTAEAHDGEYELSKYVRIINKYKEELQI